MSLVNLEELERITEKLYGPKQDVSITQLANSLTEAYTTNWNRFQELFEFFVKTNNLHCQFWIIDLLTYILNSQYKNFSPQDKEKFRNLLTSLFDNYIEKIISVTFIANKFGVLMINWLKHDYPENWPTFIKDFLGLIFNTQDENIKLMKMSMFIDFLLIFDDELIKFRHTYNDYEVTRSTIIKDYLRLDGVPDIVYVFYQLIQGYQNLNKKIIKNAIKVTAQLLDWNALNLFSDSIAFINSNLINNSDYQSECLEVLNAVVEKGMEPTQKIEIIKFLDLNKIIEFILKTPDNIHENSLFNICEIVNNMGNFTIECFEMFKGLKVQNQMTDEQRDLFNYICELANYALYHSISIINYSFKVEIKICLQLHDFLSNLLNYIKQNEFLCQILLELLKSLVNTIENYLIIPQDYDIKNDLSTLTDDDYFNFRKDFTNIFQNFFYLVPMKNFIFNSLDERFIKISQGTANLYEMELAVYLLNSLQHPISNNDYTTYNSTLNKLVGYLFNINFSEADSDHLLILYYETIGKYLQFVLAHDEVLKYVIKVYLGKKGIMYENTKVGAKICVIFDKFIEKSKLNIAKSHELSEEIANSIRTSIHMLIDFKHFPLLCDYSILFHSFSMIIFQKTFDENKRHMYFKDIIEIFQKILQTYGLDIEKFFELSKIITNFLKSFSHEILPIHKDLFIGFFNFYIKECYLKMNNQSKAKYSMMTILQRLITILGKDSIQYLDFFIQQEIGFPSEELYEDAIKLLHNASQILKKDSKELITKFFFYFYEVVKKLTMPTSNISDVDKNTIAIFANFSKLLGIISLETVEVFFENQGLYNVNLEELLKFSTYIACEIIDSTVYLNIYFTG